MCSWSEQGWVSRCACQVHSHHTATHGTDLVVCRISHGVTYGTMERVLTKVYQVCVQCEAVFYDTQPCAHTSPSSPSRDMASPCLPRCRDRQPWSRSNTQDTEHHPEHSSRMYIFCVHVSMKITACSKRRLLYI